MNYDNVLWKFRCYSGVPYGQGGEGYIRLVHGCYKDDEKLYAVLTRIQQALMQLAKEKGICHG